MVREREGGESMKNPGKLEGGGLGEGDGRVGEGGWEEHERRQDKGARGGWELD